MMSNLKSPIYIQVELTSECNNRCLHCYNFWRYSPDNQKMKVLSVFEWKRVVEILGENDIFYVTLTGGEPFLEKEKLYKFLGFLYEQNIRIMINSNATLIDKEDVRKLSEYPIEIFLVSLLSWNAKQHNSLANSDLAFEKAIKGIKLLQKKGINVAINMVATKLNFEEVYSTGKWLYNDIGIKNFSATPICPSVMEHQRLELNKKEVLKVLGQLIHLREELGQRVDVLEVFPTCLFIDSDDKDIVEIFSKRMCTAGNTTITIGSEGNVRVCSYDRESYGDILKDRFRVIWDRMEKWRDNSLLPQDCRDCVIVDTCGGGCRVNSKVKKGSYCELDYLSKGKIEEKQNTFFAEISNISMDARFSFVKNIVFRKEKRGMFLAVANPMYFVIVNEKGLEIIRQLSDLNSFVPREILKAMDFDCEIGKKFFAELLNKGFLVKS